MIKKILNFVGFVMLISQYSALLLVFFVAYSDPAKEVLVRINAFGEADIEAVFFIVTLPAVVYFIIKRLREW